jgi:hypothetical protein
MPIRSLIDVCKFTTLAGLMVVALTVSGTLNLQRMFDAVHPEGKRFARRLHDTLESCGARRWLDE